MRKLDMHMHTVVSDGSLTAEEMALLVKEAGLDAACVADHDSLGAVREFSEKMREYGIATVNAVEFSSCFEGQELHILGYAFPESSLDPVETFASRFRRAREERDSLIVHLLGERFPRVTDEGYASFTYDKYMKGGNKAANYIYSLGIAKTHSEYSELKKTLPVDDSFFPSSEETVAFIREAGGLPVLAHPSYRYRGGVMGREMLEELTGYGIGGIECLSPYNPSEEQYRYYREFCTAHGLAVSAGSDCHGPVMSRRVGVPYADDTMCDILERLGI